MNGSLSDLQTQKKAAASAQFFRMLSDADHKVKQFNR